MKDVNSIIAWLVSGTLTIIVITVDSFVWAGYNPFLVDYWSPVN
jgi:hypothetical protein